MAVVRAAKPMKLRARALNDHAHQRPHDDGGNHDDDGHHHRQSTTAAATIGLPLGWHGNG